MRFGRWWVALLLCGGCGEPVSGALELRNAAGVAVQFSPEECFDGGEKGYWGVQLRDDDGRLVDVFKRDDVPHAIVYAPGQLGFEIDLETCAVFEGRLERRSINGHGTMKGHLSLECEDSEGRQLVGDVDFKDCGCDEDDDDDD